MHPEHWSQIERIFHATLAKTPSERSGYLDSACGDDVFLRREIESLIFHHEHPDERPQTTQSIWHGLQPGERFGPYEIEVRLGVGGMGEVYQARDTRLRRTVAVKIIAVKLNRLEEIVRFYSEARALLSLNHPHIVTMYDFGESAGQPFLVTELIEGETLRSRLAGRVLTAYEALPIAIQVTSALSAIHKAGIVHRDIKPENIMLRSDGYIKVVDFGLAKLLQPDRAEALTKAGMVIGTYRYMSPEQLRGGTVDGRSDLWSLGVVLCEMISGKVPSCAADVPDLSAAGPSWHTVIIKALQREPDQRYSTAAEMLADLHRISEDKAAAPSGLGTVRRVAQYAFARWLSLCVAAVVILVCVVWLTLLRTHDQKQRPYTSLAVLPFVSLSSDQDQQYFADGMTDSLVAELSSIQALRVPSRTSVMSYKGVKRPIPQIGRELKVDTILEGTIQRFGSRVHISVHLIESATDRHLWSHSYDRDINSLLSLQGEIATAVTKEIRAQLTPQERAQLSQLGTAPAEVLNSYLKHRVSWPRGYAVIVGINYDYGPRKNQLDFAERDAEAMFSILTSPKGGNFRKEDVHLLVGPAATLARLRWEIEEWLPSVARSDDRVVIFFAGNGYIQNGKGYLAPYGAQRTDISGTSYSMDSLGMTIGRRIRAKWKIVLADACRGGAITPDTTMLNQFNSSTFLFAASRDRELAYESAQFGGGHGVFTYFLIKGIEGAADESHDGVVTAGELVEYVRRNVQQATGGAQNPTSDRGSFDADMPLGITSANIGVDSARR